MIQRGEHGIVDTGGGATFAPVTTIDTSPHSWLEEERYDGVSLSWGGAYTVTTHLHASTTPPPQRDVIWTGEEWRRLPATIRGPSRRRRSE
ncbi:hypothetical protein MRX96_029573 [Rhipicephalus microplus]